MVMKTISRLYFWLTGWRLEGRLSPDIKKCIMVAAPHTSNYDFGYSRAALYMMGCNVRYLAKKELLNSPPGFFLSRNRRHRRGTRQLTEHGIPFSGDVQSARETGYYAGSGREPQAERQMENRFLPCCSAGKGTDCPGLPRLQEEGSQCGTRFSPYRELSAGYGAGKGVLPGRFPSISGEICPRYMLRDFAHGN